jgi:hypothetical protein
VKSLLRNRWAFFPVLMLCGSVMLGVVTVSAALRSSGDAEPDYYRKGAAWDAHRAQVARNGALAWNLTPTVRPAGDGSIAPALDVAVNDKHGVPIVGAAVKVEVVPIMNADARLTIDLHEARPGVYAAPCPVRVEGTWELRFTVESRGSVYADAVRRVVHGLVPGVSK